MMDVRIMSLKRWNLPQSQSFYTCYNDGGKNKKLGDYISFQNYHFIDVRPVHVDDGDTPFSAAHNAVRQAREDASDAVYVQQSMVLVGSSGQFWIQKPKSLYITMMHLLDLKQEDLDKLEQMIGKIFESHGISDEKWGLYYAFDFCDLVLFTKDLWPDDLQNILWDLCPFGEDTLGSIRDTITTCSVASSYLKRQFDDIVSGRAQDVSKSSRTISCSLSMSVQSQASWKILREQLSSYVDNEFRSTGRYDVNMYLKKITPEQFFKVLYWLDTAFAPQTTVDNQPSNMRQPVFGGYELVLLDPLSQVKDSDIHEPIRTQRDSPDFKKKGKSALNRLYGKYTEALVAAKQSLWGYASEIKRSLVALLSSDFAEEFVLGAFNSFAEYLRLVTQNIERAEQEDLYSFQREYFQALSMFAHSTMHSEKQFIQVPAFNATLSDVPPKLLALYTSIASEVTDLLNDEDDHSYSFFFVPDFRPDIHVHPISPASWRGGKIATISLSEEMIYNPPLVIETVCHEIAHHVGCNSRLRESRGNWFFRALGTYLIYHAFSSVLSSATILLNSLSSALGERLRETYEELEPFKTENAERWFSRSLENYIIEQDYLLEQFDEPEFFSLLSADFLCILKDASPQDVETLANAACQDVAPLYISRLCSDPDASIREAGKRYLAEGLTNCIREMIDDWKYGKSELMNEVNPVRHWIEFCTNLSECYKEAYADMRMVQLLSIKKPEEYKAILAKNIDCKSESITAFQYRIRRDAVCVLLGEKLLDTDLPSDDYWKAMQMIERAVTEDLRQYLDECRGSLRLDKDKEKQLKKLQEVKKSMSTSEAQELFSTVSGAIVTYRDRLCKYGDNKKKKKRL